MNDAIHSKLIDIITIFISLLFVATVFNSATWIVGNAFGFKLKEFGLGFGPELFKRTFENCDFVMRLFPFGGSINFYELTDHGIDVLKIHELSTYKRTLFTIAGPISQLIIGFAVLSRNSRYFSILSLLSIWTGLFSFIPFPASNGFILITGLIPSISHKPYNEILPHTLQILLIIILLLINFGLLIYFIKNTDNVLKSFTLLQSRFTNKL